MNYLIRWYNWKINLLEINSMQIESIINSIKTYDPNVNSDQILKAYEFSKKVHSKQIRASGVPYLEHPIQVAKLLTEIKLDGPATHFFAFTENIERKNICELADFTLSNFDDYIKILKWFEDLYLLNCIRLNNKFY